MWPRYGYRCGARAYRARPRRTAVTYEVRPSADGAPEPDVAPPASATRHTLREAFREERLFLLLAVVIGILSGLAVVCFRVGIEFARLCLLGSAGPPTGYRLLFAPATVGLVVAFLVMLAFPRSRGSGVNQTKAARYIYTGS